MNDIKTILISKAREYLTSGLVDSVYGWKKGEYDWDLTPALFNSTEELEDFEFGSFSGANFSKYLIEAARKTTSKILVFLKPCDSYSFNQLLTEHRFDREKVYAIGIPCDGMLDINKIREKCYSVLGVKDGEKVTVATLYDGEFTLERTEVLAERCINCKSKKLVAYDELIGENGEVLASARFDEIEKLEKMTPTERFEFWQAELSRCIRCNACRDVCPACTCEKCVFDNPDSGVENKAASNSFEEKMFHIIRAFHVVGRCTDCGECSRVCPQHIPLHLLNRKFIKDINEFYGEYQAGAKVDSRAPIVDFNESDIEAADAVRRADNA